MSWLPNGFLEAIPKSDLHVHLDGSLRLSTLIELAKKEEIHLPAYDEETLRREVFKENYKDLPEYLNGFQYTIAVMKTEDNLERISYEFAVDNFQEGVRYFEVRFAPQLLASAASSSTSDKSSELTIRSVLRAVNRGLNRAKDEYNASIKDDVNAPHYDYGIIVCAMRMFPPCEYYDTLSAIHEGIDQERVSSIASEILIVAATSSRDIDKVPIVALDVAGAEDGFPNKIHRTAFDLATKNFFAKTVHAGEGFGPESIFQAIMDLHAERVGHGFHLFSEHMVVKSEDKKQFITNLIKYIADRRICLEVCLTSNLNTMPGLALQDHAIRKMIDHGLSITVNTDNRLVSDTTVVDELRKAVDVFALTPKQLKEIVITGFKRSFYHGPYSVKRKYMRRVMDYYDKIAKEYCIEESYAKFNSEKAGGSPFQVPLQRHMSMTSIDSISSELDATTPS